jgi:predicted metal-dependent hydrolase
VQQDKAVAAALRRWLTSLAEVEFSRELRSVAQQCGLSFKRVQIRRQRTRWGSCSASGTISLNVCLMFMTPAVVRYLFVHELCHTRHMNHSRRFWSLVASHEPEYQQLDRELLRAWQHVPGWMFA